MGSSDGGNLLLVSVQSSVVVPAVKFDDVVVVVVLPARVVDVRADLVASDDGTNTTAGATLTGRDGNQSLRTSRSNGDGGSKGQSEGREVLHCADIGLSTEETGGDGGIEITKDQGPA